MISRVKDKNLNLLNKFRHKEQTDLDMLNSRADALLITRAIQALPFFVLLIKQKNYGKQGLFFKLTSVAIANFTIGLLNL